MSVRFIRFISASHSFSADELIVSINWYGSTNQLVQPYQSIGMVVPINWYNKNTGAKQRENIGKKETRCVSEWSYTPNKNPRQSEMSALNRVEQADKW